MTVTNVEKDVEALTMTLTAEFEAPATRVWQLWEDPRQLERWWGPPTFPATFVDLDLSPDGRASYYMTGPEGEQPRGWWRVIAVDAPRRLEFEDGFADHHGNPNPDMPTMAFRVDIAEPSAGRTRMAIQIRFRSAAAMEQIVEMGLEEGLNAAVGQIDDVLRSEVSHP